MGTSEGLGNAVVIDALDPEDASTFGRTETTACPYNGASWGRVPSAFASAMGSSFHDSRPYVERADARGIDARLDVWTGRPHESPASIGAIEASEQALDVTGMFLTERPQASVREPDSRH